MSRRNTTIILIFSYYSRFGHLFISIIVFGFFYTCPFRHVVKNVINISQNLLETFYFRSFNAKRNWGMNNHSKQTDNSKQWHKTKTPNIQVDSTTQWEIYVKPRHQINSSSSRCKLLYALYLYILYSVLLGQTSEQLHSNATLKKAAGDIEFLEHGL